MRRFSYLLLAFSATLAAQEVVDITPRPPKSRTQALVLQGQANIRVDSSLVLVPVVVTDRRDELITGLRKTDFMLYEDGVPQDISHFASEDVPVSIAILFDSSGSMANLLDRSRMAVTSFLEASNPDDEFALIEFNRRASLLIPFTENPRDIANRLPFFCGNGSTALLDAIHLGLVQLQHAHRARKAIVMISDGGDNHSRYSRREIRRELREADVQVYAIGIINPMPQFLLPPEEARGVSLMEGIANLTGGRLFRVGHPDWLPEVAQKIGTALRGQYILAYSPVNPKRDGKYHRIQVKLAQPQAFTKARTSFRSGYLAREQ